ncbi:hypothetical protein G9A89_003889 [Geosiphon pyriformis]|nr:hypothetical protein G9A89_003889 [Geosiphon pyriformis]
MKSLHHRLSVAMHKHLYDGCYSSVVCLSCGNIEFSDYVFVCLFETAGRAQFLDAHVSLWETRSGLSQSTLCVSQLLASCFSNATISTTLYKGFVFDNWYHKFLLVFKDAEVAALNIVCFVSFMERNRLIPHDGSIPALVPGLPTVLSANVIRLLGVIEAFGVGFGFCKSCLFFSDIGNFVSVKIGA